MAFRTTDNVVPTQSSKSERKRSTLSDQSSHLEGDNDGEPPKKKASKGPHRRNYQACDACRSKKIKCELGNPDDPRDPPCDKCRREHRECVFAAFRKKTKKNEAGPKEGSPQSDGANNRFNHLNRRGSRDPSSEFLAQIGPSPSPMTYVPRTPISNTQHRSTNSASLSRPTPILSPALIDSQTMASNVTLPLSGPYSTFPPAQTLQQVSQMVPRLHGASLPVPWHNEATFAVQPAIHNKRKEDHVDEQYAAPVAETMIPNFTNTNDSLNLLANAATASDPNPERTRRLTANERNLDLTKMNAKDLESYRTGIETWEKMEYVKAGWFTAAEALHYVNFFYINMAPMSPILTHEFRDPGTHRRLLEDEPVLAIAILAIASRYTQTKDQAHVSRGYYIHEKLWDALKKIVQRLIWGQEQFGGGFCSTGPKPTIEPVSGQISWKGSLRTLGTVEALLLFTDWQPRALHFPPSIGDNKLIEQEPTPDTPAAEEEPPFASFLEPSWRSDRMSWMLLGVAQTLAFELGVFSLHHNNCPVHQGEYQHTQNCINRRRIRQLLITYAAQVSGRVGIMSILNPDQDRDQYGPSPRGNGDVMRKLWFDIAMIMFQANRDMFPSKEHTASLVSSGGYRSSISTLTSKLSEWLAEFKRIEKGLETKMRHVLRMEYEYARLYINSLGLQKVLEVMAAQPRDQSGGPSRALAPVLKENQVYLTQVRDASRKIMRAACIGLGDIPALSHAPIRTFLRSLTGMMFTLKLFALGGPSNEIGQDFALLRETNKRLSRQTVDDVHLSTQITALMDKLMTNVKKSMRKIPTRNTTLSGVHSRQVSPPPHLTNQQNNDTTPHQLSAIDFESPDYLSTIRPVDPNSIVFVPPPNFDFDAVLDPNYTDLNTFNMPMNDDWMTMDMNPMMMNLDPNQGTINLGHGGIGPTVGNKDFLDIMTLDYDYNNVPVMHNNAQDPQDYSIAPYMVEPINDPLLNPPYADAQYGQSPILNNINNHGRGQGRVQNGTG